MTAEVTKNSATAPGVTWTGASNSAAPVMPAIQSERAGAHRTLPSTAELPPSTIIRAVDAHVELSAGEIASRFSMSKPSISQHLWILEAAGLVVSEKRGRYVFYRLVPESLANTLNGFVQEVCPVSRPLKRESAALKDRSEERE